LLHRLAEVSPDSVSDHGKEILAGALSVEELLQKKVHRLAGASGPEAIAQGGANSLEFRLHDGFNGHVWFLFDDLWASAHPAPARSLLRFALPI
jgi:hypothetical protein